MRILQVLNDFFPDTGGTERVVLELGRKLQESGHQVVVLCGTNRPDENEQVHGLPVIYANHLMQISQVRISFRMLWHLIRKDTDVIHTHLPFPWSADCAALVGKLRNVPVVLTYHNDIAGEGWRRLGASAYNRSWLRLTLALVDRIVVLTSQRLLVSSVLTRFTSKISVIPDGIDAERFRPLSGPRDGKTIGCLALLRDTHRYKGIEVLLRAMSLANDGGVDIRLKIGGEGNLLPYYRSLANELGVGKMVEFLGFVPEDGLVEFYNSLDAFVLPSTDHRFEGFGLVALEALACGRPVVTTSAAGIGPIIAENGCGTVVTPGDPRALADAITGLLSSPDVRTSMAQRSRRLAERLSWDSVAEAYCRLYDQVVASRGEDRP